MFQQVRGADLRIGAKELQPIRGEECSNRLQRVPFLCTVPAADR
jgi:hypothetical protein